MDFHVPMDKQRATNNAYKLATATYKLLHNKTLYDEKLGLAIVPQYEQSLGELATAEGFLAMACCFTMI